VAWPTDCISRRHASGSSVPRLLGPDRGRDGSGTEQSRQLTPRQVGEEPPPEDHLSDSKSPQGPHTPMATGALGQRLRVRHLDSCRPRMRAPQDNAMS